MVSVYTDASVRKGKAVASCFVISDDSFIGYRVFEYTNVCSALQGEMFAIRDALTYVVDELGYTDEIDFYCDSEAAIKQVTCTAPIALFKNVVLKIVEKTKKAKVNFLYVRGHQYNRNANKIVDLTSNSVLRYKYFEKKEVTE